MTVRLSQFYEDMIDRYLKLKRGNAEPRGQKASRADVVRLALDEFFKKEGLVKRTRPKHQINISELGKEQIFVHTLLETARGKTLPSDHKNLDYLRNYLSQMIEKKMYKNGMKADDEQLEEIVDGLFQYHQRLLEMLEEISNNETQ